MKYLTEVTENYRVDTDAEAKALIEEAKSSGALIKKTSSQYKERKLKGEVVDAWYKITIVKVFNNEKEPMTQYEIKYEQGSAF